VSVGARTSVASVMTATTTLLLLLLLLRAGHAGVAAPAATAAASSGGGGGSSSSSGAVRQWDGQAGCCERARDSVRWVATIARVGNEIEPQLLCVSCVVCRVSRVVCRVCVCVCVCVCTGDAQV
jgi:hypothetical protein